VDADAGAVERKVAGMEKVQMRVEYLIHESLK